MPRLPFIFSVIFSVPILAVVPTIHCADIRRSITLEEGIEDFLVAIQERAVAGSLTAAFLGQPDSHLLRRAARPTGYSR